MTKKDDKTLLKFPCDFPIKIVGKADLHFQGEVLRIFRKHFPGLSEAAVTMNYSKESTYVSLTITVKAESQSQLDAIYQELSENEHVLMAL